MLAVQLAALQSELERLEGRAVLAWSAGKDSTALLAVAAEVWRSGVVVLGSHGEDGYPGTPQLLEQWRDRAPHLTFEVLSWSGHLRDLRDGGGRRVARLVAARERHDRHLMRDLLARHGVDKQILAIRSAESVTRQRRGKMYARHRNQYVAGRDWGRPLICLPMLHWTEQDVLDTITLYRAPVHPLYRLAGWQERSHPCLFMPGGGLNQRAPWAQPGPVHFPDWWEERCAVTPGLAAFTDPPQSVLGDMVNAR